MACSQGGGWLSGCNLVAVDEYLVLQEESFDARVMCPAIAHVHHHELCIAKMKTLDLHSLSLALCLPPRKRLHEAPPPGHNRLVPPRLFF